MFKIRDEIKVKAYSIQHLQRQIKGRRDTTIFISHACSEQIRKMDYNDYLKLEEDLKTSNIKIKLNEEEK